MTFLQVLTPLEWFAFIGMPAILVTMGWVAVKANEAWAKRERQQDREREKLS